MVFGIIGTMIDGTAGVTAIIPFFAAAVAAERFIADRRRAPNPAERNWLLAWSMAITVVLGVLGAALVVLSAPDVFGDAGLLGWLAIACAVILLVNFGLMYLAYGWLAQRSLAGLIRREQRKAARAARR